MNQRETEARALVSQKQGMINTILNGDKAKASAYLGALVNLVNDSNLQECSVNSILNVGFAIVQAGLNPNKLFGQAYAVPFNLKNGGKTAQLNVGYKGWIALGYRNGWRFKSVAVYKCDSFNIKFGGFEDVIDFEPNYELRQDDNHEWIHKNLLGVIVYAKDSNNEIWTEFVSFKKLEKLRLKSDTQNNKNEITAKSKNGYSLVWGEWAEEMYKAKALKYVITKLPINENIMQLAVEEDKVYTEIDKPKEITNQTTLNNLNNLNSEPKDDIIELNINPTTGEILPTPETAVKKVTDFFIKERVKVVKFKDFLKGKSEQECETLLTDPAGLYEIARQLKDEHE